jgi:hypothetical protein
MSILIDVYASPPAIPVGTLAAAERTWCIARLSHLAADLDTHLPDVAQLAAHTHGRAGAMTSELLERWHADLRIANARCVGFGDAAIDRAYTELGSLHVGVQEALTRLGDTHASLGGGLGTLLRELQVSIEEPTNR